MTPLEQAALERKVTRDALDAAKRAYRAADERWQVERQNAEEDRRRRDYLGLPRHLREMVKRQVWDVSPEHHRIFLKIGFRHSEASDRDGRIPAGWSTGCPSSWDCERWEKEERA